MMPPSEGGGVRPPDLPPPPPANLDDGIQGLRDAKPDEGDRLFWVGYRSYWQGDYDKALVSFDGAVRIDDRDARFWYYKALTERAGLGISDLAPMRPSGAAVNCTHRQPHEGRAGKRGGTGAQVQARIAGSSTRPEIVVVSDAALPAR